MRGLVLLFMSIAAGIVLFSILAISMRDETHKKQDKNFEFSTFTSAVCEDKGTAIYCKDQLFVNCNGNVSKADGVAECNGISLGAPKITGFAVFGKDWKDPRD